MKKKSKIQFFYLLYVSIVLIFPLTSCENVSDRNLKLVNAVKERDIKAVESLLKKGASPNAQSLEYDPPISIAFDYSIEQGKSDELLELLTYYMRHQKQAAAAIQGKLVVAKEHLGISSQGFLTSTLFYIKSDKAEYEIKFAGNETKVKGIEVMSNLFFLKIGGLYKVTGTLNESGQLEADTMEYLGGGDTDYNHNASDFLPSSFKIFDEIQKT